AGRLRALPAPDRPPARPRDRRDGAGAHPRCVAPGRLVPEPDRPRRLRGVGAGTRALLPAYLGRALHARPRDERPGREPVAGRDPGSEVREGDLRVYRARVLPAAPGGRARGVPVVRESAGVGGEAMREASPGRASPGAAATGALPGAAAGAAGVGRLRRRDSAGSLRSSAGAGPSGAGECLGRLALARLRFVPILFLVLGIAALTNA